MNCPTSQVDDTYRVRPMGAPTLPVQALDLYMCVCMHVCAYLWHYLSCIPSGSPPLGSGTMSTLQPSQHAKTLIFRI